MKLALPSLSTLFAPRRPTGGAEAARAVSRLMRPAAPARELDPLLIWSAAALLLIGLVMVYSASIAIAEGSRFTGNQSHYFLLRHGVYLALGTAAGLLAFQVPMGRWQQAAPWLFMVGVLLLVLVLIPGIGREVNGARRWLSLGPVNLQPSELMKVFVGLYAADYTVRKLDAMGSFKRGFLPMAGVIVLVGCLLLMEPDFGAFVVICAIAFGVLFLGGVNARVFAFLVVVALVGFALLVWLSPHSSTVTAMAMRISAPPMVGVPALVRCDLGPSSRTAWPIFFAVSQRITRGPNISEIASAVSAASTARSVM